MTDTYQDIINRLLPLYERDPNRFMAFYNAVWLMCYELPEGHSFRIADRCGEKSRKLFLDIVCLTIMEEPFGSERGELEISDDGEIVSRRVGFRPSARPVKTWSKG